EQLWCHDRVDQRSLCRFLAGGEGLGRLTLIRRTAREVLRRANLHHRRLVLGVGRAHTRSVTGSNPGGSEQTRVASPPVRTTSHWTMQAARWLAHLPIAPAAASSHLKTRGSTIAAAGAASSATAMPSASAVVCLASRAGGRSRGIGTTTPLPSRIPTSLRSRILGGGQSDRQEKFSAWRDPGESRFLRRGQR